MRTPFGMWIASLGPTSLSQSCDPGAQKKRNEQKTWASGRTTIFEGDNDYYINILKCGGLQ